MKIKEQKSNFYVGGVSGVGKSTLLNELKKQAPKIKVLHGTSILMKELGIKRGDYERLRRLSQNFTKKKYKKVVLKKIKENKNQILVFDSHYLNLKRERVTKVTGFWIKNMNGIILIIEEPEEVFKRITKDNKDRALFLEGTKKEKQLEILKKYLQKTKEEYLIIAQRYHLPHLLIKNDNNIKNNIQNILAFIKKN